MYDDKPRLFKHCTRLGTTTKAHVSMMAGITLSDNVGRCKDKYGTAAVYLSLCTLCGIIFFFFFFFRMLVSPWFRNHRSREGSSDAMSMYVSNSSHGQCAAAICVVDVRFSAQDIGSRFTQRHSSCGYVGSWQDKRIFGI